jgi:hypothetical protein
MAWKNFAIARRQRAVATALVYGLSLTVRFTSTTGEEASAQATQGANPMNSIMLSDAFYNGLPPKPALPIGFTRGWPLSPRICRAACEGSVPTSLMLTCPAP